MKKFLLSLLTLFVASVTAWATEQTITLDYSSFGLTTSYALKTATVDGYSFTVNQGYKGSGNTIQMNSSKGSGILYNTTAIQGLKSITVNVAQGNKTYTITTGTSEKPSTNSQTGSATGTYNAAEGDTFFQLKVSGASYFSSIVITYDPDSGSGTETVATPEITPGTCNFTEAFKATVTCATSGASIYYSLDGSDPATLYSGAITIPAGANVTLKAKATKADYNDSAVAEAVYTYVEPAPEGAKYQLVDLSDITASDIVVIYDTTSERAMSNNNGASAAPSAVAVASTNSATELVYADVTDDLKWNIVSTSDGYVIYPNGTTDTWLYCTSSNNGVRVGTNANKYFTTASTDNRVYLQHIGTSRYLGVYQSQDWRCYTSMGGNIASQNTKFYRYVANAGEQVEAPVISPNGGSDLIEAQTVTLSCETEDASIYYTLDGSTPTAESTLYSAPFQVSETTTVKAIAIKEGLSNSSVASATFSFRVSASSIADLYAKTGKDDSTQIYVNFPLTVTAAGANTVANTYVMDGQGGYSMIYKADNTSYNVGDVIPGGWYATVQTYGGLDEIKPTANTPEASSTGASVDYSEITAADVIAENQALPATLRLKFNEATPSNKTSFTGVSGETSISLYNTWVHSSVPAGEYYVRGVVSVNNNNPQFLPLEYFEIPVPDVYILGNVNGNSWSPSQGVQMTYNADGEMYTATITVASGGGSFSFATALGEGDDWNTLNGRDVRWGHGGSDYTLSAEDMQGQNAIACSKYDWTTGSYVVPEGEYNLTLSFDGDGLNAYLFVEKVEAPKDVYILGTVNTTAMNWVPYEGVLMTRDEDTGLYSAEVYAEVGDRINFAHFLGSTWAEVNVPGNRFSVPNQNYMVNDSSRGIQMAYSTDPYSFEFGSQGKWEVVVNLDNEGEMTVDFTKLTFAAPTFSEESKEFHAAFDLTITGPEGSTITYVLNDDLDNAVTTQSNVAVVSIPAEDTSVLAWATMYGVDSESAEENYLYSASTGTTYTKLASGAEVKAGKYLIVYEVPASSGSPLRDASSSILAFDGSRTGTGDSKLDAVSNHVTLSADNGSVTTEDEIYFTITPLAEGGFSIKSASGYYIGTTSDANIIASSTETVYTNYIEVDDEGANIMSDKGAYLRFNSASNQDRFRYYKSSTYTAQKAIQLYYSDTTGVDSVAADSEVVSTAYYNLQGVRLAAPAQGQVAIRVSTLANGQIRASKVVVR